MASRPEIFTTIQTEGALLPPDLLQRVTEGGDGLQGLRPSDYFLLPGERLNEAISHAWSRLQGTWISFQNDRARLAEDDPGTTLTRNKWLQPLFTVLEFGQLDYVSSLEVDGKSYPISHRSPDGRVPLHLVGCNVPLGHRTPGVSGAATASPHSTLQVFLNRSDDHLWGIVSNGLRLRLLRDNVSLTRQAFIEFDLEAMMEGEVYADFVLLYLLLHKSRFKAERPAEFWIEQWRQAAIEQGTRALDQLRDQVQQAIEYLGAGFLDHPANARLRERLASGALDKQDYYRQLLRLVYRLLFLFTAEDRGLLVDPAQPDEAHAVYLENYSTRRLRTLAERFRGTRHHDAYAGLRLVMRLLGGEREDADLLGLPVLDGFLFRDDALPDLIDADIANRDLLDAVRALAFIEDKEVRALRPVDYRNLGPEELGSVYESLLELHPELNIDARTFALTTAAGHERKTTGSYYTPDSLVQELLKSALEPVLEEAKNAEDAEQAILDLKVCDPATGSGHFLVAAAHRLARALAQVRTYEEEPPPEAMTAALRDVIGHCIYGVDINPMAVELCKVSLWMEALEPGKPLTFLDHRIKVGNSLLGTTPRLMANGIPEDAFPTKSGLLEGDDYDIVKELRKKNRDELNALQDPSSGVQMGLFDVVSLASGHDRLTLGVREIEETLDDTVQGTQAQANAYRALQESYEYQRHKFLADLWCAAFVWRKTPDNVLPPTSLVYDRLMHADDIWEFPGVDAMAQEVEHLTERYQFFHWHIEFPDVFDVPDNVESAENEQTGWNGGFDCVVGNPPWEKVRIEEKQWFSGVVPTIAEAPRKSVRTKLIKKLKQDEPSIYQDFLDDRRQAAGESHLLRVSDRYPLTAAGDINTYSVFVGLARSLISGMGSAGLIVPTGIATDSPFQEFFDDIIQRQSLDLLIGFENEEFIFPAVANVVRFCLLVLVGAEKCAQNPTFAYYVRRQNQMSEQERFFHLSTRDIELLNPNTHTCPVFRTDYDAELTKRVYRRFPVLFKEENRPQSPWEVEYATLFHMSNDSDLFETEPAPGYCALYEAKLLWHFDHRFGSYELKGKLPGKGGRGLPNMPIEYHQDPNYSIQPRYWVPRQEVEARIPGYWEHEWLLAFRDVASAKVERTSIFSIIPRVGYSDPLLFLSPAINAAYIASLLANFNTLIFDYIARQKVGGTHLKKYILYQLPVIPPEAYSREDLRFIVPRVLELVYTAWDIKPFADDVWSASSEDTRAIIEQKWMDRAQSNSGAKERDSSLARQRQVSALCPLGPLKWDEERRRIIRAELDAYYAHLYGLDRDDVLYVLDPANVFGDTYPGETFRVLREKEEKEFGEFLTQRLVLEAWDRQFGS